MKVRKVNSINQVSWSKAVFELVCILDHQQRIESDLDETYDKSRDYKIDFRMDSRYAFEFEDSIASWSNGCPKSFRLKWMWGGDAIESHLGGRRRGNWAVVRIACEFLCTRFPSQLALVISNGFSGYNDDMGTIFFDGSCRKYQQCPYDSWPWVEEENADNTAKMLSESSRNLNHDIRRANFLQEFHSMMQQSVTYQDRAPEGAITNLPRAQRSASRSNRREQTAALSPESLAALREREASAQRLADELIKEEEEAKRRMNSRKANSRAGRSQDAKDPRKDQRPKVADGVRLPPQARRGHSESRGPPDEPDMEGEPATRNGRVLTVGSEPRKARDTTREGSQESDPWVEDSEWTSVQGRRRAAGGAAGPEFVCGGGERSAAVRRLLGTWKTEPCADPAPHDWRLCGRHHAGAGGQDARRDPFAERYLPEDARNKAEEAYHPITFRSRLCARGAACPFRSPYVCAFAHAEADLRGMKEADYLELFGPEPDRPPARLGDFMPAGRPLALGGGTSSLPPTPTLGWRSDAAAAGRADGEAAARRGPAAVFVALTEFQDHLVASSCRLWRRLADTAALYLCRIERHQRARGEPPGLLVSGERAEADMVAESLREVLVDPPEDLVSRDSEAFSGRVVALVRAALSREGSAAFGLGPRDGVLVEADAAAGRVAVRALRTRERPALGREVLGQIRFWLRQQGLDRFVECAACLEGVNPDQCVQCPGGHSFCTQGGAGTEELPVGEGSCMAGLIKAQLASIRAQEGALICPVCRAAFAEQEVAARVSAESWGAVQRAVLEARVERRYAELQSEFDQRLQLKVRELVERFDSGNVSDLVNQQGATGAVEARNSALNLACPHCRAVYSEFDGCMALQCASCERHFCGYCHKAAACSRGCHEHVRECDMNLTSNGSYFATQEIVREAQRRYRVKKLKHFLRSGSYKKEIQNSIVFHLSRDLKDLGIDPAALFDVGNLQVGEQGH